jgi:DNA repair exonuclease SbcCD ATPase subunit
MAAEVAKPNPVLGKAVSSIEARRILAVLEDCKARIEYALLLPTLNDFLDGRENLDEEIQVSHAELMTCQQRIASMITADGDLKQGRNQSELDEETSNYKDLSRDLVRVMRRHHEFFAPLLQQSGHLGGSAVKLVSVMKDLNDMMDMTFSTPVESDNKQRRMLEEINQRKKTSREYIEQLSTRLTTVTQERDKKVRAKEDQLDEIKQALQQARANEQAMANDDGTLPDEIQSQEESLKQQLADAKAELTALQKTNSEDEAKQLRAMRKEEEALQALTRQYDSVMSDLTEKIKVAAVEAELREKEFNELQTVYDDLERQRAPLKHEEQNYVAATNIKNKTQQDVLAATVVIQAAIKRYLKTAPKIVKKRKSSKKKKK